MNKAERCSNTKMIQRGTENKGKIENNNMIFQHNYINDYIKF